MLRSRPLFVESTCPKGGVFILHCHKVEARFHNPLDRIRKFQEVGNFDFTYSPCSSLKAGKEDLDLATAVGEEGTGVTTDGWVLTFGGNSGACRL